MSDKDYTLKDVADGLGVSQKSVYEWLALKWIRGEGHGLIWHFSEINIRSFLRNHADVIDQHKVDWLWVVSILAGDVGSYVYRNPVGSRERARIAEIKQANRRKGKRGALTIEQVTAIRQTYLAGEATFEALAEQYGVSRTSIWKIIHRVSWKDI